MSFSAVRFVYLAFPIIIQRIEHKINERLAGTPYGTWPARHHPVFPFYY